MKKICLWCKTEFEAKYTKNNRGKFCGLSCSSKYNNKLRPPKTDETKQKIKASLLKFYENHPEKNSLNKKNACDSTYGKHKGRGIKSILDVSKRTASKILKRLNLGCCICGWKEASCDIHHINGRKVNDANSHWNLTCVCPNHHRAYHNHKIRKEDFIPLDKYFPENWRDVYYG